MRLDDRFTFGKFEEIRLIDVYRGTLNIDRAILKEYINYMFQSDDRWSYEAIVGEPWFQVMDEVEVTEKEIKITGMHAEPWSITSDKRLQIGNIEELLEDYLSRGNNIKGGLIGSFTSLEDVNKLRDDKYVIGAAPHYIVWCIRHVDGFFIDPDDLDAMEKFKIAEFKGFHVFYKGNEVFEYAPKTELKTYTFSDEVKLKNREKWEEAESMSVEPEQDDYEDFSSPDWPHEELMAADWEYDPNNQAHDPSENPWIDVFGPGEEAEVAYWNTE